MSNGCTVCAHPSRRAIDKELALGKASLRKIGAEYGVTHSALARHRTGHLPDLVRATPAAKAEHARELIHLVDSEAVADAQNAIDIGDRLRFYDQEAMALYVDARRRGDHKMALQVLDRAIKLIDTQARLLGTGDQMANASVLVAEMKAIVLAEIAEFPEARQVEARQKAAARLVASESG